MYLPSSIYQAATGGCCSSKVLGGKKGLNRNAEGPYCQDELKAESLNVTNFPYRKGLHY